MNPRQQTFYLSVIFLISIILLMPVLMIFLYSLFSDFTGIVPKSFTLKFYLSTLSSPAVLAAIGRTILIAFVPTVMTLVILLLAMYAIEMKFKWFEQYMRVIVTIPYVIQGVILAVSLISLYIGTKTILSNRLVLLVFAYCVIILPYMYQGIKNTMETVNMKGLLEAAQVLGANKFYAYLTIIVPSMKNGIFISGLLCMGIIFSDFVLVNILAGSHYQTISIYLAGIMARSGQASSVVSVLMFVVMLILTSIVFSKNNQAKSF
ncbi:MAG: ABC transporter permease subunit [Neisseria sp.]|nr:ABC transporter permease subunit [Neisseria sp.]